MKILSILGVVGVLALSACGSPKISSYDTRDVVLIDHKTGKSEVIYREAEQVIFKQCAHTGESGRDCEAAGPVVTLGLDQFLKNLASEYAISPFEVSQRSADSLTAQMQAVRADLGSGRLSPTERQKAEKALARLQVVAGKMPWLLSVRQGLEAGEVLNVGSYREDATKLRAAKISARATFEGFEWVYLGLGNWQEHQKACANFGSGWRMPDVVGAEGFAPLRLLRTSFATDYLTPIVTTQGYGVYVIWNAMPPALGYFDQPLSYFFFSRVDGSTSEVFPNLLSLVLKAHMVCIKG